MNIIVVRRRIAGIFRDERPQLAINTTIENSPGARATGYRWVKGFAKGETNDFLRVRIDQSLDGFDYTFLQTQIPFDPTKPDFTHPIKVEVVAPFVRMQIVSPVGLVVDNVSAYGFLEP